MTAESNGYPYGGVMNPDGTTGASYGKPFSLYPEKGFTAMFLSMTR